MRTADIRAVLLETPGLSGVVGDLLSDPSNNVSWVAGRINESLADYGWTNISIDTAFVRQLADEMHYPEPPFGTSPVPPPTVLIDWGEDQPEEYIQPLNPAPFVPKETKAVSINKVTYVNGMDVENMSVENFLAAIKKTDAEIKRLTEMEVDSKTVNKAIEDLKSDRVELVKLLDEKHGDDESAG